ncbi:deoxyribodipyrimidine photolyase [Sandaracinus amylolyticus]|uniref:deoxyribodipyrimidine photolyase n=1 Tax=Sandaracinus amylolyticus TaxID=927083 RepID=UPI001F3A8463|nr:deoxyribodipyrimidine photolyase [Sandaracinus amylolyticus]UJR79708.1 Deoxyribodipyrimidine photo-lyase type II [Sandaracinus amylolyticus]
MVDGTPAIRVAEANARPERRDGAFVLYWMLANRRTRSSFPLERAIAWAKELDRPLVILEPLRCDYPFASERFHRFVVEGMADNARAFAKKAVLYHPWVERRRGEGRGLIEALAAHASLIVADDSPIPWLRGMVRAAAERVPIRVERVDHHGLMPLRATPRAFPVAHAFRRFLQKELPLHLAAWPQDDPLARVALPRLRALPREITERWPAVGLGDPAALIAHLPIDHTIGAIDDRGGSTAAHARLAAFLEDGIDRYPDRSHPDDDASSRLSSWLHFGHVSSHEVLGALGARERWTPAKIAKKPTGTREGWWNVSDAGDAFLDELVTWRELGAVRCHHTDDFMRWEGLPAWARETLEKHAHDPRPALYDRARLVRAETDDPVWNAAQRQLLAEGRIQNYLRMLWGKRVLAWTAHPREAFDLLIELNDRYSIDGRDPASWLNVGWVFGAYDRPWAPQRPIYGSVRYMTSESAKRKLRMKQWLAKWS